MTLSRKVGEPDQVAVRCKFTFQILNAAILILVIIIAKRWLQIADRLLRDEIEHYSVNANAVSV